MARIVYIEDELDIQDAVAEELADSEHEVYCASNGAEGLELIVSQQPDLVICDCLMPVMNGHQVLAAMRSLPTDIAGTPFIYLSAHADKTHIDTGMSEGADIYLTKPVNFERLSGAVDDLLATSQPPEDDS